MKIEIELSEVEELRKQVDDLTRQNMAYNSEVCSMHEQSLRETAHKVAKRLTTEYIKAIFQALGFNVDPRCYGLAFPQNAEYNYGMNWHKEVEVTAELSAELSAEFSNAFLEIGVVTPKQRIRMHEDELTGKDNERHENGTKGK